MSLLDASQYQLLLSGMGVTLQLFLVSWVMAVSYTHLDVYKRQLRALYA